MVFAPDGDVRLVNQLATGVYAPGGRAEVAARRRRAAVRLVVEVVLCCIALVIVAALGRACIVIGVDHQMPGLVGLIVLFMVCRLVLAWWAGRRSGRG